MDGLPLLQTLAPHGDVSLVVGHSPAFLAQTLRLEAGERPVVRDGHAASRHGSLPDWTAALRGSWWARGGDAVSRGCEKRRKPVTLILLLCGNNLSNSISSLKEAFVGCAASCDDVCAFREEQAPQSSPHKLIKQRWKHR